ncbi:hypothetical protein [uncultured Desulfobacter sp.]|uniref:hypothetical protein n=1 Tax=uncultured Desulfobacter sp. TaxID=240139 RepID=UPI0029F4CFD7|nr:hypothetical protein [uncultured Desulfobacter sp.]
MNNMENQQCPFSQSECITTACRLYDRRLNNCQVSVLAYNLYKLDQTLKQIKDLKKLTFPFPTQREN